MSQGFFQALCHTTVFAFHIEFVRCSHAKGMKKSAGALQSVVRPPVGPGQSPGGGQRNKAPEAQRIWVLRNFYCSLKSIILC